MARLTLLPAGLELAVGAGERVLDALDLRDEGPGRVLPVRCRAANCATCLVRIEVGAELLTPADAREREVLEQLGATDDQRLGCQMCIRVDSDGPASGAGVIRLRVVGPV